MSAFPELALPYDFVDALAALRTGNLNRAAQLRSKHGKPDDQPNPRNAILLTELDGLIALSRGDHAAGIALLREATGMEEALPYEFGPPATIMPPHELLAAEISGLSRQEKALRAWQDQLARTPKRTQSLLGMARTAMAVEDENAAREAYAALAEAWSGADEELPGLGEARAGGASR